MCTRARPSGGLCEAARGRRGVTIGIRADPHSCPYGSVCGHRAHGACGPGRAYGMDHGAGTGRTGVCQGGTFLDICSCG
jgi:hypothetical protein